METDFNRNMEELKQKWDEALNPKEVEEVIETEEAQEEEE